MCKHFLWCPFFFCHHYILCYITEQPFHVQVIFGILHMHFDQYFLRKWRCWRLFSAPRFCCILYLTEV
jgi:hypothetical protein